MWEINVYNVNNVSKKVVMLEQGGCQGYYMIP
jgi:hypothetical protein